MNTPKWFDRKFDFNFNQEQYISIYQQLKQAPVLLQQLVSNITGEKLSHKPDGKWSAKEHIGHLTLLESLWLARFHDIRERKPVLTPTDLNNTATTEAGFNNDPLAVLLEKFVEKRNATITFLDSIDVAAEAGTSLHPRLQQPMRMIDHAYFVAEHDDHHLAAIRAILEHTS